MCIDPRTDPLGVSIYICVCVQSGIPQIKRLLDIICIFYGKRFKSVVLFLINDS